MPFSADRPLRASVRVYKKFVEELVSVAAGGPAREFVPWPRCVAITMLAIINRLRLGICDNSLKASRKQMGQWRNSKATTWNEWRKSEQGKRATQALRDCTGVRPHGRRGR
mmetsp:Transcript_13530/g.36003  ORF Transcript_13530/g.36003 Transcript_13530/m.36003 type:complete len:111 (+) Transcript_13530:1708-2040(+)